MTHFVKPRLSSNASIFAERGDPWVSDREGREKFGRNLSSERPELDAYLFAGRARKADVPMVVNRPPSSPKPDDIRRMLVGKILAGKRKVGRPRETPLSHDTALAKLEGVKRD